MADPRVDRIQEAVSAEGADELPAYPEHRKATLIPQEPAQSGQAMHGSEDGWGFLWDGVTFGLEVHTFAWYGTPYQSAQAWCDRTGAEHVWFCASHGHIRSVVPCKMLDCKTCEAAVRQRRGARLYRRFGGVSLRCAVFTFPAHWHSKLSMESLAVLKRKVAEVCASWVDSHEGLAIGVLVHFHPQGDRCGLHRVPYHECGCQPRWKPHFHALIPAVGVDLETGETRSMPTRLPPKQLEDLRFEWGLVLEGMAAYWGEEAPVPNVHYSWRDTPETIMHRMGYDARPFPEWRAGQLSDQLSRTGHYGLAAPNVRRELRPFVDAWRERVRAPEETPPPTPCPHPGCTEHIELLFAARGGDRRLNYLKFTGTNELFPPIGRDPPPI